MADLYSLVHRDFGPIATFTARQPAEAELAAVVEDEPGWAVDLWVEEFTFYVEGREPRNGE